MKETPTKCLLIVYLSMSASDGKDLGTFPLPYNASPEHTRGNYSSNEYTCIMIKALHFETRNGKLAHSFAVLLTRTSKSLIQTQKHECAERLVK